MSDIGLHGAIDWRYGHETSDGTRAHLQAKLTTCLDTAEAQTAKSALTDI